MAMENEVHASHLLAYRTRSRGGNARSQVPGGPWMESRMPSAAPTASRMTSRRRCSSPNAAAAATRTNGGRKSEARYVPPKKAGVNPAAESRSVQPSAPRSRACAGRGSRRSERADSSAIGTSTQAASASPRMTAAPQRLSVIQRGAGATGSGKGARGCMASASARSDRRGRHLGAARHRLKAYERAEAEDRGARPQTGARERRDPGQVCVRAEVIPEHRERGGETRGGERRGAEERARVGDVLLLEKPARPQSRDREVEQEKESAGQPRRGEKKQPCRRIEHPRLAVREPGLAGARQGIPEGNLARAQAVHRVQLQRIEEIALIAQRRGLAARERRKQPQNRRKERRGRADPRDQTAAQQHPAIVAAASKNDGPAGAGPSRNARDSSLREHRDQNCVPSGHCTKVPFT